MQDERISSLLDSNNELSLELAQKNETIQELQDENASLRACSKQVDSAESLIEKIKNQKKDYELSFKSKEFLTTEFESDIDFIESIELPTVPEVKTKQDIENLLEISTRVKTVLSKFHKARASFSKSRNTDRENEPSSAFEAKKQMIQNFENEQKTVKETIEGHDKNITDNESETVETTTTYESFDIQPTIEFKDLSTQTDFTPTMSFESFDELNKIRLDCPASTQVTVLMQKESQKERDIMYGFDERTIWFDRFQTALESVVNKDQIKLINTNSAPECSAEEFELIQQHRASPSSTQPCSSQTEISTLLIGMSFDKITPSDDTGSLVKKLNARLIALFMNQAKLETETNRLKQYCDDLNAGKEISVLKNDLSESNFRVIQLETEKRNELEENKEFRQKAKKLLKKVKKQKSRLLDQWSDKIFLGDVFKAHIIYAESLQLPGSVLEVTSVDEFSKLEQYEAQLGLILSEFHDAYKDYQSGKLIIPQSDNVVVDPVEKTHFNDLSTQTDFTSDKINSAEIAVALIHKSTDTIDLPNATQSKSIDDLQLDHHEIFAQLERKVKSTLNFEIDEAIKKSTESLKNLQITNHCSKLRLDETENQLLSKANLIEEQSKRITEIEIKLSQQISNEELKTSLLIADNVETERKLKSEQSKVKELDMKLKGKESEISKLNTRISNQTKTNSQQRITMTAKCKEFEKLKKETSNQQTSQAEVNKLKTKIRQVFILDLRSYPG